VEGIPLAREREIKRLIGLVTSDERSFYARLSGRQNLEFFAALHGFARPAARERAAETLALVGLEAQADKPFQHYSTGMKQRLSIARALLARPRILLLDEPTRGLDPVAAGQLHHLIRDQLTRQQGLTVLFTSHNLEEVQRLCDRVAIMSGGRIRACGTLAELQAELPAQGAESLSGEARSPLAEVFIRLTAEEQPSAVIRQRSVDHQPPSIAQSGAERNRSEREQPSAGPATAALAAFLRRDWHSETSYKLAFALQFANIFFTVAVFYFVAQLMGTSASPYLAPYGGDYFSFVLIGISFSAYFGVGLNGFAGRLRTAQTTGTLEAMLATPAHLSVIILGSVQWSYLLTTLRVLVYLLVGVLFLGVRLGGANYLAALAVLVLTVISFSSLGVIAAAFIMVFKRGNPVTWLFGAVSSLLGGTYYPIEVLPDWLQKLSALIPVTYALRAMRLALLQGAGFDQLRGDLLALGLFCVVLLPLGLFAFSWAVRMARRDGSLTHY
jgi:ABC-2 type transport system permease protein